MWTKTAVQHRIANIWEDRHSSKHRQCVPLAEIGPGQFGHLTGDTFLTKISHGDKLAASGQLGLQQNKTMDT